MKQRIFRLFSLLLLGMVATGVQATPFKNIYVKLSANIPGAGTVYMKTDDPENAETAHSTNSVEMKATLGENGDEEGKQDDPKGLYECWLYAIPEDGYELVGFTKVWKDNVEDYVESDFLVQAKKNNSTDNNHSDGFRVNVNSINCPVKRESNLEDYGADQAREDARGDGGWSDAPDHHFYAIFKPSTAPVNRVTVTYYKTWLNGTQNDSYGTWTSEVINEGANVKLTAIPAPDMRLVGWYNADQSTKIGSDLEMIVDNVNSTYVPYFDLPSLTLNSELSTYSYTRLSNFQTDGDRPAAYMVTAVSDKLTLVQVRHANPNEGVILQGEAGHTYQEMTYMGLFGIDPNHPEDDHKDNLLKGTASGPVQANGKIYVLAKKNQGLGFYKLADGAEVPQGKAYLEIDDANNARDFIGFDDGTTTSISSVAEVEQPTPIYNMAGQRVSSSFSGLVIQNGRKYIRK